MTGHRSLGRLVTPASACPRSGHSLRGPGQEPRDVPRAADPRDYVQVSVGRAAGAGGRRQLRLQRTPRPGAATPPSFGKGID